MGSLECREKTQLPSQWDSVSLKKEGESESKLVGNPCLTTAVMLNVGLFYFLQNVASTDTETLHCSCVKL